MREVSTNLQTWDGGRGVGVPSDVMSLLDGQELAGFRLATCLLLSLAADLMTKRKS